MNNQIHPSSIIGKNAVIGSNNLIGPNCIIGENVVIGDNNLLKSNVVIENKTTVGNLNTFYPFSSIGTEPQDLKYNKEETSLEIGNNNVFRESCTISIGTIQDKSLTKIRNNNLFMTGTHVAHDCQIGSNNILANLVTLGGHVIILENVVIGGCTAVQQFIKIGSYTMIGGMSGIDKNILPFSLVIGNRANYRGINIVGLRRKEFTNNEIDIIKKTNLNYLEKSIFQPTDLNKVDNIYHSFFKNLNLKIGITK